MASSDKLERDLLARLDTLSADVFLAVARGELGADAGVVQAIAAAMAYLRGRRGDGADQLRSAATGRATGSGVTLARGETGMLEHVLAVAAYVSEGLSFAESCVRRGAELSLHPQSVRGACCKAQGLLADDWNRLAAGDDEARRAIRSRLLDRYPRERSRIDAALLRDG